jgi:DNA-binding NarL/FixJ family response regulator
MVIYAYDSVHGLSELKKALKPILGDGLYFSGFTEPDKMINACIEKKYDIAFIDITYHGRSGMLLLGELYWRFPYSNYIGVTAEDRDGDALTLHRIHASGYIIKPYERKSLEETLRHLRFKTSESEKVLQDRKRNEIKEKL